MRSTTWALCALLIVLIAGCAGTADPSTGAAGDALVGANVVQDELTAALKDTDAPPGVTLNVSLAGLTGEFQPGYGRAMVQQAAICAWFRYWLTGLAANDSDASTLAAEEAEGFKAWDTYTSADQSFRDVIDAAISKTNLGDPAPMRSFVTNNCPAA
jgi:hypothetical protein